MGHPYVPAPYIGRAYLPGDLIAGLKGTSTGFGPYLPGAYGPRAYCPGIYLGSPVRPIAPPAWLFTDQMASFVALYLGQWAYPNKLPSRDTAYPLLSYTIISGDNNLILRGATALATIGIQFDVWSSSSFATELLSEQLRLVLQDLHGMMGLVCVANCIGDTPRSSYTPSPVGSDLGLYRSSRDFTFWYYR